MEVPNGAKELTFGEIVAATNNFAANSMLGSGGTATVYRGRLDDGREVAIKRLKNRLLYPDAEEDFHTELSILSSLRHKHVLRLIGWCAGNEKRLLSFRRKEEEERLLVCAYMNNGTLFDRLQDESCSPVATSWRTRVEVLLGVSRGIEYLHCHAVPAVIHRDIKSGNIFLDASWAPRVSDFGVSVLWRNTNGEEEDHAMECSVRGTIGYLDPEYYRTRRLKPASDLYSFGVVILEVLTGKSAICLINLEDEKGKIPMSLASYVVPIIEAGQLRKLLDRRPAPEPTIRELEALDLVAHTATRCVQMKGKDRPPISDVVANLETAFQLINLQPSAA